MSTLLALDASSSACSCAVWHKGEVISRFALTPREHTRRLMPMIDEVLAEAGLMPADLDALAYGRGPGSFTGLRIAAGVAQGLAFGLDRPLIGVSTLEALALAAHRQYHLRYVISALDARMNEIYVAAYRCQDGRLTQVLDETVMPPEQLRIPLAYQDADWCGVGSGWALWDAMPTLVQAALSQRLPDLQPDAADMVRLAVDAFEAGDGQLAHEVVPVYLRDQVAWQKR
ncbi:tRNA (adenosine(37)-N6)-threonylcarbamoyltransferase complex dimerization subunit type 1 TsaB [Modicisalibacter luteus]|uniref:tRNA threonylcarbamoyladenosine biosynthesis protein TsaB n=1 Tax=Modicisalibacter luteus TaxID=453962 RepID=A0ABV7M675_9GAMM|nr:tRNA (adenosine(37)-N6)-threonylcarbamoyltransferase complex dimerization subunit type 1 TsaB [Halomonas lutea]GHA99735.1 tRNA (adenosine(37)-N6)-threonylcarbamoyltransferase complex dimerization subunit type 1 TsaB [Halomonas lutea]